MKTDYIKDNYIFFLFFSFLSFILFHLNSDLLTLPLFGDEFYYAKAITGDLKTHFFEHNFGHPPLWNLQVNIFYSLFGIDPIVPRVLSLLYSWLLFFSVALITKKVFNTNASLVSMLGLFTFSTFQRESFLYYSENAMLMFSLWGTYFFYKLEDKKAFIFFVIATFIRENAIAFPVAAVIVRYFQTRKLYQCRYYFFSLIPLTAFFAINYIVSPEHFLNTEFNNQVGQGFVFFSLDIQKVKESFSFFIKNIDYGLYVLFPLSVLATVLAYKKLDSRRFSFVCLLGLTFVFSYIFFMLYSDYANRDFMNMAVSLVMIGCVFHYYFKSNELLLVVFVSILFFDLPRMESRIENRYQVLRIKAYQDIYRLVEGNENETLITESIYNLLSPLEGGYGKKEKAFSTLRNKPNRVSALIVTDADSHDYKGFSKEELATGLYKEIYRFSDDGEFVIMYKKTL